MGSDTRLNSRDELKVNIEAMARCGGSCRGCVFTAEERAQGVLWSEADFARALPFVSAFVAGHAARADFTEIAINFGQGDHLLVPADRVDGVVRWVKEAGGGLALGYVTASAIGRRERVAAAIDAWRGAADRHGQAILVDMVFDPAKTAVERFHETYAANIAHLRAAFGDVDLNVNVGPDTVAAASPAVLHAFVRENGFSRLTLNLTPVPASAPHFAGAWDAVVDWINGVLRLWDPDHGYDLNTCPTIAPLIQGADAALADAGPALVIEAVREKAAREIFIDPDGLVSHTQAGFGDVAFGRRIGHQPTLTLDCPPGEALAAVEASADRFARRLVASFSASRACQGCRYLPVCPRAGVGGVRQVMARHLAGRADGCPAGVLPLLDGIRGYMATGADMRSDIYTRRNVFVPHGFDASLVRHAVPVRGFEGGISFDAVRGAKGAT